MAKLPTVKLIHKKTGEKRIVNQTDYSRDISAYTDYKILSIRSGDARDDEIVAAALESDVEKFRRTDPDRERRFGDKARKSEERAIRSNIVTEEPGESGGEDTSEGEGASVERSPVDPEWRKIPWQRRRKYVREISGEMPKTVADAERLMKPYE